MTAVDEHDDGGMATCDVWLERGTEVVVSGVAVVTYRG